MFPSFASSTSSTLCPPVSFHYFVLFTAISHSFLPAAVGARCRARVICRGGYESAECPSGCNIILNDDIGGARGTAETASRSLHVRGVTREMKITEQRVHVCYVYVCVCMCVSAHVRRLEVSSSSSLSSLSSLSPTNGSYPLTPTRHRAEFRSRISKYDTSHLSTVFTAIEEMSDYKENNAFYYFQS